MMHDELSATAAAQGAPAWWDARYRAGDTPWDTGIVPPEVVALVNSSTMIGGWALDLGCGSGVTSRYLARHGFRVVGVDLAHSALVRAGYAARTEGTPTVFCSGDVTDLGFIRVRATLAVDIGCFHAVAVERRPAYIRSLAAHLLPGAFFLLYAFEPSPADAPDLPRIGPQALSHFAPYFTLCWAQHGHDRERPSAWYLWRRAGSLFPLAA